MDTPSILDSGKCDEYSSLTLRRIPCHIKDLMYNEQMKLQLAKRRKVSLEHVVYELIKKASDAKCK